MDERNFSPFYRTLSPIGAAAQKEDIGEEVEEEEIEEKEEEVKEKEKEKPKEKEKEEKPVNHHCQVVCLGGGSVSTEYQII